MLVTPSTSAEKINGTISMNSRRRNTCPTGCATQRTNASSPSLSDSHAWLASPEMAPTAKPINIREWSGSPSGRRISPACRLAVRYPEGASAETTRLRVGPTSGLDTPPHD